MSADSRLLPSYADLSIASPAERRSFNALVDALRDAQEAVTRSRPSESAARRAAALLSEAAELLGEGVPDSEQLAGRLWDEPGRAQALAPPLYIDDVDGTSARGRVTFSRFHAGVRTVHGGALPLVFDEIMGRLATTSGKPFARTAHLTIDYRAGVPVDTEVEVFARVKRVEGRKLFLSSELCLDGTVLTECQGLWVQIREDPR
ncbi:PaaI family thioesterase [Brevibacterium daeguense]|uniref:Acyl-coenzyme A thioesterase THEM4 n=1 Tax=Brevibacterium daeguense TaxID=909936 RepID=A0ABP8EFA7_9MICO|nr:PaaI family thioesterase [Brevibacterium daeguense]